jgi:hypothetical protein
MNKELRNNHINPHQRKREQQSMKVAGLKIINQYGLSDKKE